LTLLITFKGKNPLSSKAHIQAAKPESSTQVGARTNVLQRQRTALLEPDDAKETAPSGYDEFRYSAPSVPNNPNLGHNFGRVSVFPPMRVPIQPKLKVSEPDDVYEQEADRVADTVMRMPEPMIQRKAPCPAGAASCKEEEAVVQTKPLSITPLVQRQADEEEKEDEEPVQAKLDSAPGMISVQRQEEEEEKKEKEEPIQTKLISEHAVPSLQRQPEEEEEKKDEEETVQTQRASDQSPAVTPSFEASLSVIKDSGQPLSDNVRSFFEPRFGHDFSNVRVHYDDQAVESARAVNARAFTLGPDVVFGAGQYMPGTAAGRKLLAHELTHVVQQNGGRTHFSWSKNSENSISNPQESGVVSPELRISKTSGTEVSRQSDDEPGSDDSSVTHIIDALEGITTANDSAIILVEFQGQSAGRLRAILAGLKAKAPGHGVTPEGMIDWLFSDMTAEDGAALRRLLIRAGVHREINRIIVDELYARLSGYTSDADSQEIYALLVQYTGGGLDKLLEDLATRAKMSGDALGAWLLGDLDRANAERVRVHFLTLGAAHAADYAAEFTAAKIESLLSGYTSHADSSAILRNFQDTPQKHRPTVQAKLEARTQASRGQSVADALMEDMGRKDYEALRALGGVTIRAYDYTPTWFEKLISGAEWGMIVAEWIVCGLIGVITGVIGAIWDIVMILADAVVGIWHLLWSLVYWMTGRTFGSENWLKVKQFFAGLFEVLTNPSTAWDQYWESVGLEFKTIEGPLTDCRRAEFFMRKLTQAVVNIALIALAGYGIAKGIASAIKTAQAVARLRLLTGGVRNALRLVRLGGNGVDDVARLETLLASPKVASVGELETLLSHAKVANAIELDALLSSGKVQSSAELQTLLDSQKLATAAELQTLLSHAKLTSAAELQGILNSAKVTSAAEVQAVLNSSKMTSAAELQALLGRAQITSLAEIESLLGHSKLASAAELDALLGNAKITSVAELNGLLNEAKISSAAELQGLLSDAKITNVGELRGLLAEPKIADAGQLQGVLGGTADVAELNRLLALVDDAAQLERFQAAIGNSVQIERLIRTAGLGNPPVADASRLDRVLAQMGAGPHPIPAIETELAALKKLDSKILRGEPRTPTPPGVAPMGLQREIRGVHSASVLTDPNFQITSIVNNADGTVTAELKKLLYTDPSTGAQTWSKPKRSTLAPATWTERDILAAGDRIAATPAALGPRTWGAADGATMHHGMVNGVQWVVIKDAAGRVTSSFPTGGTLPAF
jgi:hypothetical protein